MKDEPLEEYKLKLKQVKPEFPKVFKKICCPSCEGEVLTSNLNIKDKVGMCNDCNIIFPFDKEIADLVNSQQIRQEVLRPEGIDLFHFQGELDISVEQPYTAQEMIPLFFASFFSFLFIGVSLTVIPKQGMPPLPLSIIILSTWTLAAFLIHRFLNRSKHKIHINIDDRFLTLQWRPKKLVKDKEYEISDINQVYIQKDSLNKINLHMIVDAPEGQKHIKLISDLKSSSKAAYLEQEIERYLGIENRVVPEEKT